MWKGMENCARKWFSFLVCHFVWGHLGIWKLHSPKKVVCHTSSSERSCAALVITQKSSLSCWWTVYIFCFQNFQVYDNLFLIQRKWYLVQATLENVYLTLDWLLGSDNILHFCRISKYRNENSFCHFFFSGTGSTSCSFTWSEVNWYECIMRIPVLYQDGISSAHVFTRDTGEDQTILLHFRLGFIFSFLGTQV